MFQHVFPLLIAGQLQHDQLQQKHTRHASDRTAFRVYPVVFHMAARGHDEAGRVRYCGVASLATHSRSRENL